MVCEAIKKALESWATLISDEWHAYRGLTSEFDHHIVDYGKKQYVNMKNREIHSNTIEGFWGIFKRGYNGIYNWMSRIHMQRYFDEFAFRYNHRKITQSERFLLFIKNMYYRTTYKQLTLVNL